MAKSVLYFPFINVPNKAWFNRKLLYWDSVSAIVPYEFIEDPDKLDPHMRDLVREGLVRQIVPSMLISKIPECGPPFVEYLDSLAQQLPLRQKRFATKCVSVHADKMPEEVKEKLLACDLARLKDYRWLEVEEATANEYMAYLAAAIGRLPRMDLTPVTDSRERLNVFLGSRERVDSKLDPLRLKVLRKAFPSPRVSLNAQDISRFRNKYGDLLPRFRNWVENKITHVAAISDPYLQAKEWENVTNELEDEKARIESSMNEYGFKSLVFGDCCAILGDLPKVGTPFKLLNAIYRAGGGEAGDNNSPLAYAAYASRELKLGTSEAIEGQENV